MNRGVPSGPAEQQHSLEDLLLMRLNMEQQIGSDESFETRLSLQEKIQRDNRDKQKASLSALNERIASLDNATE